MVILTETRLYDIEEIKRGDKNMIVITKEDGYTVVTDTREDDIQNLYDITDALKTSEQFSDNETMKIEYLIANGYASSTAGAACWFVAYLPKTFDPSKQKVSITSMTGATVRGAYNSNGTMRIMLNDTSTGIVNLTIPESTTNGYSVAEQASPAPTNALLFSLNGMDTSTQSTSHWCQNSPVNFVGIVSIKIEKKTA